MIVVVGSPANEATSELVEEWRTLGIETRLVSGVHLGEQVEPGDVVLGRLDVLETLDGIEPGLLELLRLERRGFDVLNGSEALLAAHDKLRTARLLHAAHLPQPKTVHVRYPSVPPFRPPYVVKPRFGSWGRDVYLCHDGEALLRRLTDLQERPWFRRHGALVQEALPNNGRDLRVVVAGGRVVGAGERIAAPEEWRTNVSCGGELRPTKLDPDAAELARVAAAVIDADFVGVDLMPTTDGRLFVLELNGAVEFDDNCALDSRGGPKAAADALGLVASVPARRGTRRPAHRSVSR
jgi:RimK family alpha-L-glutamate ligase